MTEKQRYKVNFSSKGGSFNADQFAPRIERSYYNYDPPMQDMFVTTDFKEKDTKLSFDLLKQVSTKVAPIAAVISTRIDQVGAFTSRSKYSTNGVGFKVKLRDSSIEPSEEQEKTIDRLERFIENCGNNENPNRDNFDIFIRKILRDSLTYDQVNFELEYDITGEFLQAFEAVDPTTIKPTLEDFEIDEAALADDVDTREGEELAYVQVIDGQIVAGFTADEMAFSVRNPRTDVYSQPYGLSEIELIVSQVTSYLEAEEYNMRFFQQGGMTKGILNIKNEKGGPAQGDRQTLESFKRQWRTQVTGQKGAWKIPVFTLPGELEFINIAQSGGEMVFEKWINYLINIICAIYKIDPAEINFPNNGGVGGKGSSLFSGDKDKVDQSKAKGLLPLLQYIENIINRYIISRFNVDDEYVFVFDGLDNESESEQVDLAKRKTESYMTINEVRTDKGLPEIDGGDIIANPYYLQAMQLSPGGDSMGFDFDSYGDDEEDNQEESPEDNNDTDQGEEVTSDDLFSKSLKQVNIELEKEKVSIDDLKKSIYRSKLTQAR
ncbi:phage portal protein [Anaerococcus sp. NML200537]|uniref:phage portal protein n=1 Tax=Anaerococcus sp. NML200537 TaxID=2954485 RepID=UPI002236F08D|nr:phage portal protein [Anaerococcus sp. NML200537]MCW6702144.1 phage portal protein [Anaerococcus sp. NML200537]